MKFLLLVLALISQPTWAGSITVFEREYTYNASENDSKVSARKAAMQQLQSLLIQEVGVQVQSSFSQSESLDGDDFSRQVQVNYKTFSQALTKTRILKQHWDGENFYLKAEVTVDTDNLLDQIKLLYVDSRQTPVIKQDCKSIHNHAIDLLAEANKSEVVKRIVEYSAKYPIDEQCYRWQLGILNDFRSLGLDPIGYRENLFQRIENEGASFAGDLQIHVLRYALAIRPLSDSEWNIVKSTLKRSKPSVTKSTISLLVKATKAEDSEQEILLSKASELSALAIGAQLGAPKQVSVSDVVLAFMVNTSVDMPRLFIRYYEENHHKLDADAAEKLTKNFIENFKSYPNEDRLSHLNSFIANTEFTRTGRRFIFPFIMDLRRNQNNEDFYPVALSSLIEKHPEKLADLISKARYNKKKKERILIEYNLPVDNVLSVQGYAKKIFDKKKSNQVDAAKYLVAFGDRAEPVKAQVVKRLSRIKALKKVTNPRNLIVELIQVLENIEASDKEAIEVLVWAIGDLDGEINKKAQVALVAIGADSLPHVISNFDQQKPTARRRLVEVMGTFAKKRKEVVKFLKSVKPDTEQLRFAIEDSMAELQ